MSALTKLSITPAGGGQTTTVATDTIFDAKGDLVAGTGADAATKVTVGANGTILVADSAVANGVKWQGAWTGFTPTLSGTGGSAGAYSQDNVVARYIQHGSLIFFYIGLRIADKGSWSGDVQVAYPVAAAANTAAHMVMSVYLVPQGENTPSTRGFAAFSSTSVFSFRTGVASGTSVQWSAVVNADWVIGQGFYEVA